MNRFMSVSKPVTWEDWDLKKVRLERRAKQEWNEANATMHECHGYGLERDDDVTEARNDYRRQELRRA